MPELRLAPCHSIQKQVCGVEDGDCDGTAGLVAVIPVFIVPDLACMSCVSSTPRTSSGPTLPIELPHPKPLHGHICPSK